jgi:hypothetical protein
MDHGGAYQRTFGYIEGFTAARRKKIIRYEV